MLTTMKNSSIKKILKPTKLKIIITVLVIIVFMAGNRITTSQEYPPVTLFFKINQIIFMPVSIVVRTANNICSMFNSGFFESSCIEISASPSIFLAFFYFALLLFSFFLNIFIYYLLTCILLYVLTYIKRVDEK